MLLVLIREAPSKRILARLLDLYAQIKSSDWPLPAHYRDEVLPRYSQEDAFVSNLYADDRDNG
jgi:hypothetical protein